ncbi:MAG: 2Fe-2S iron-sulfur cluster binding domain-containing protein, partial [Atopobiaceae bacterium]|nr:2Fe-2S iron-sulfur cluster binding domain-containing protein [Atopobiaceae bacterium]
DYDLTILYGSASSTDIICKEELDAIAHSCDRVSVTHVISGDEEELPGDCQRGLLSADLIMLHSHGMPSEGKTSFFVCGPLAMYRYVLGELKTLGVPERRIRTEVFGSPRDPRLNEDYSGPSGMVTYQLTVHRGIDEQVIPARSTEPIAVALERAAIPNHTRCRSGACGYCRCKLLSGDVYIPQQGDGRRMADKSHSYIHACSTWPLGDCAVEVPIV